MSKNGSFDWPFFISAVFLWTAGIFLIHSATYAQVSGGLHSTVTSQILWVSIGIFIILGIVSIPSKHYYYFSYLVYGVSVLLLLYVIIGGITAKGAGRWVFFGGIKIQPSEFAKIGVLFGLARYLSKNEVSLERPSSFIMPCIIIGIPFLLVIKQPDLGTALVFCAMSLPIFYWAGLSLVELFFLISPGISIILSAIPLIMAYSTTDIAGITGAIPWGVFFVFISILLYVIRPRMFIIVSVIVLNLVAATVTTVLWNQMLKDYQKDRIISFVDPQQDPAGAGYQVIQSKVAIGSGHIFGKGYLKGTQTRLSFLPEQHTDFIFSVLGEQFGFLGSLLIISVFTFIIIRGMLFTRYIKNRFINLIVVGALSILTFHIFINIAMTIGIMPVTGLPLPFLSYGGSFTVTISIITGLLLNAKWSRHDF